VVNAVTKAGTNNQHGDLFYYLRYPTWNALDSYSKSKGQYSQPSINGSSSAAAWRTHRQE